MFKKTLLSIAAALTLGTSAFAATLPTVAVSGEGLAYNLLYTESSWMALELPLSALGNGVSVLDGLTLDDSGLPAGLNITLDSVSVVGDRALLHVTVTRDDTSVAVNALASLTVRSGGEEVATLTIPVIGAASAE